MRTRALARGQRSVARPPPLPTRAGCTRPRPPGTSSIAELTAGQNTLTRAMPTTGSLRLPRTRKRTRATCLPSSAIPPYSPSAFRTHSRRRRRHRSSKVGSRSTDRRRGTRRRPCTSMCFTPRQRLWAIGTRRQCRPFRLSHSHPTSHPSRPSRRSRQVWLALQCRQCLRSPRFRKPSPAEVAGIQHLRRRMMDLDRPPGARGISKGRTSTTSRRPIPLPCRRRDNRPRQGRATTGP